MFRQNCCNRKPMGCCDRPMVGCDREIAEQIIEPAVTKCVEKNFVHEVPHACHFM